MFFEVKGKLLLKYDTQQVTEKFKKREFVLEIPNGMYPEQVKFQLTQDRCPLLDNYNKGDEVTVKFTLRGRPYTGKNGETTYFTNLEAMSLQAIDSGKNFEVPPPSDKDMFSAAGADDDLLPF